MQFMMSMRKVFLGHVTVIKSDQKGFEQEMKLRTDISDNGIFLISKFNLIYSLFYAIKKGAEN